MVALEGCLVPAGCSHLGRLSGRPELQSSPGGHTSLTPALIVYPTVAPSSQQNSPRVSLSLSLQWHLALLSTPFQIAGDALKAGCGCYWWFSSGLSVAGRAQYLLHADLQRVRASVGDHPQSHHRHRPRPLLWEQEAVGGDVPDRVAEPPQPVPSVRTIRQKPRAQRVNYDLELGVCACSVEETGRMRLCLRAFRCWFHLFSQGWCAWWIQIHVSISGVL